MKAATVVKVSSLDKKTLEPGPSVRYMYSYQLSLVSKSI